MRPIAPLDRTDLAQADLSGAAEPILEMIAPTDLLVDDSYQRDLSVKSIALITAIVAGWDWLKFKPPVVAMSERGLEVVDGQHSAIAAATLGIAKIPCMVVDGSRLEDRAGAFVSHATNRLQATRTQVWHAAVAAGDKHAILIRDVCATAGVDLVPFPPQGSAYRPGQTIALGAIQKLIARRGPEPSTEILTALARAGLAPITAEWIKAGEALLCDDDYAAEFDAAALTAGIRSIGLALTSEAKQLAAAKGLPMWRALAAILFKQRRARRTAAATGIHALPSGGHVIDRRPATNVVELGDLPAPGRSALDQRRACTQ